jgi:hypothetical protein
MMLLTLAAGWRITGKQGVIGSSVGLVPTNVGPYRNCLDDRTVAICKTWRGQFRYGRLNEAASVCGGCGGSYGNSIDSRLKILARRGLWSKGHY